MVFTLDKMAFRTAERNNSIISEREEDCSAIPNFSEFPRGMFFRFYTRLTNGQTVGLALFGIECWNLRPGRREKELESDPLVPKKLMNCYLIDSLSLALRQRARF
jgi:hypothetical protein